jgi:hypothetical protein
MCNATPGSTKTKIKAENMTCHFLLCQLLGKFCTTFFTPAFDVEKRQQLNTTPHLLHIYFVTPISVRFILFVKKKPPKAIVNDALIVIRFELFWRQRKMKKFRQNKISK